jgi:hypothetical protein
MGLMERSRFRFRTLEEAKNLAFPVATGSELRVQMKDQGKGFDWRQYLEISPGRATHPQSRGIATSRMMSFTSLDYIGCGNEVLCTVAVKDHAAANEAPAVIAAVPGNLALANS